MTKSPKPTTTGSLSASVRLAPEDLYPLLECRHSDPHRILGVRADGTGGSIARVFHPGASGVVLSFSSGEKLSLTKVHADGLFEAECSKEIPSGPQDYILEVTRADASSLHLRDAYAFAPMLGDLDLYLLGQGEHLEAYKIMGAHPRSIDNIGGTSFAVWAPNAQRISVVGDFNAWDGRRHMMRRLGGSGVW